MKTVLIALVLLTSLVAVTPEAAAQPCEIPGCNVVGAALCLANATLNGEVNPKDPRALTYCLQQTA